MSGVLKPLLVPKEATNVAVVGAVHIDHIKSVAKDVKQSTARPGATTTIYVIRFILSENFSEQNDLVWEYANQSDRDLEYSALLGCLATQIDRDSVNSLLSC